ncbi:MAG: hypothetical protein K8R87_08780, partial [Verrucomicrobia bacterium]|nr:hypothetical protein [Verrucomicrobiota bacterium]
MKSTSQSLVFTHTPASLIVSVVFVLAVAMLAAMAWRRTGYRAVTGWLELLRVVIAICIAITLNQPEWREIFKPDTKPVLAVLWDHSRSMDTRDVLDANAPKADPKSRAEIVKALTDATAWDKLRSRMDVVIEPFSSAEEPPQEATDINSALLLAMEKYPRLAAVVLTSDGSWNSGDAPSNAATRLRMRGAPVFAVPVGAESKLPDVELVSFEVPTFAIAGKPLRIPFTIESSLPRDESVTLEMKTSSGE